MIFLFDLAFAMALIALSLGLVMLIWGRRNSGPGVRTAKFFGFVIALAALFAVFCSAYHGAMAMARMHAMEQMMQNGPMPMARQQMMMQGQQNPAPMPMKQNKR